MRKGNVLSSLTDASMSFSFPFLRRTKKRITGEIKPKTKAVRIVTIIFAVSYSKVKANIVNTIIVKDGGTKRIEINLANFLVGLPDSEFKQFL